MMLPMSPDLSKPWLLKLVTEKDNSLLSCFTKGLELRQREYRQGRHPAHLKKSMNKGERGAACF
jgi:23S rRNA G2445 N2-methylase RlmL